MKNKKKVTIHVLVLFCAIVIIFFWTINETLYPYSLQLTAILVITLIAARHLLKPISFRLAESTVSTMCVLLICTNTGGVSSPLFFFNYILLFELSLLLEPVIPIFLSLALIVFYFYSQEFPQSLFNLLELAAFPLMTPLAYLFAKIYNKEENQKKEIKNLVQKEESQKNEIKHLAQEIDELKEEIAEKETETIEAF